MTCLKCGVDREERFFAVIAQSGNRRRSCRVCYNTYVKTRYKADKEFRERQNAAHSKWAATHQHTYEIQKRYGLSKEEYYQRLEAQQGCCALCNKPPSDKARRKKLVVDHDHKTGRVRGLLCGLCNVVLGRFNDDPAKFERVVHYLKQE